jgi:hypothetical protein
VTLDPEIEHTLRNQLAIVLGYCEMLLLEVPEDSSIRADLQEMHRATTVAMALLKREDEP